MDLIDRYLATIGYLLPRRQREDITAELRDILLTRKEEQEQALGRPLTREEESALLRAFGNPIAVAARYGRQHYLVGPELYPLYVLCVKVLVAIVAVSAVFAGVIGVAVHLQTPDRAVGIAVSALWNGTVSSIGSLTIIAAVLQHYGIRLKVLDNWNPQHLPSRPIPRPETAFQQIAGIVFQTLFILFWTGVLPVWFSVIPLQAPGQVLHLAPAPIWRTLYWPVIGLALAAIVMHAVKLAGPTLSRPALAVELALQVAMLAVAGVALHAGRWIEVSASGLPAGAAGRIEFGVNVGLEIGLTVAVFTTACRAAYDAWRLFREDPARA